MAEYDNTNDGVAYPPFEDMRMILQGKINVEGRDSKAVIVQRETKTRAINLRRLGGQRATSLSRVLGNALALRLRLNHG